VNRPIAAKFGGREFEALPTGSLEQCGCIVGAGIDRLQAFFGANWSKRISLPSLTMGKE
jgi:hypothetical protein